MSSAPPSKRAKTGRNPYHLGRHLVLTVTPLADDGSFDGGSWAQGLGPSPARFAATLETPSPSEIRLQNGLVKRTFSVTNDGGLYVSPPNN